MGTAGYIVFGGFLLILLAIGFIFSKNQKDSSDFWVGGRSFGPWVLGIGITASIMHGGTLLSGVGLMSLRGPTTLNNLSFALGFFIVLVYLAKKMRRFGGFTISDYLGERFESNQIRLVSSSIVFIASIVTLIAQTKTMGLIVGQILGIPINYAIILGAVIFTAYTMMGGMKGVIWTNIVQFVFMMVGVIALAFAINRDVGGMTTVMTMAEEAAPGFTSLTGFWEPMAFVSWHFVWLIAYFTRVEMVTKMYAAKDERAAKWSLVIGLAFLLLFINFAVYFSAAARFTVMDNIASSDQALTTLFTYFLSPTMAALALAGLAAAAMSTTDSLLLMVGACISHDFLRKGIHEQNNVMKSEEYYVKISKITIACVGVIAIIGAMNTPGLILIITSYAVALTGSSFALPLVLGFNWKRVSSKAVLFSMIGGFLASGTWAVLDQMGYAFVKIMHPIIPGFIISLILILVVTLSTKPVSEKTLNKFFPIETAQ